MDNLVVYLINLDRSPERLAAMTDRLSKLGLSFVRIPAVDGKKTEFTEHHVNKDKYIRFHGKEITPTEVACYVSHYNVMREFFENSEAEYALVLEDDMLFSEEFLPVLKTLITENKNDWDLVKFNGGHSGGNVKYRPVTAKTSLVWNLFHQSKTGAYLINRKAGRIFAHRLLPMFVPIDHEYIKFWKYHIRGFSLYPFPTCEEGVESTIDYKSMKKNKKPWNKRIFVALYRSGIALRRIVWVIGQVIKNKFTFHKK